MEFRSIGNKKFKNNFRMKFSGFILKRFAISVDKGCNGQTDWQNSIALKKYKKTMLKN